MRSINNIFKNKSTKDAILNMFENSSESYSLLSFSDKAYIASTLLRVDPDWAEAFDGQDLLDASASCLKHHTEDHGIDLLCSVKESIVNYYDDLMQSLFAYYTEDYKDA